MSSKRARCIQPPRPQPRVHEWSQRQCENAADLTFIKANSVRPMRPLRSDVDHAKDNMNMIKGGSPEAVEIYKKLYWEKNDSDHPHLNWEEFPLDILVVNRVKKPAQFFVDDPQYQEVTKMYKLINTSCVVCNPKGSIMCVFITANALPSLNQLATQARTALEEAKRDLKPRHSFGVGGDYARDPDYSEKIKTCMKTRMLGTIWNDGLQTYTSATPGWQGMYFTQYFRRLPGSNPTLFSLPYVGIYAVEQTVVPAVADARLTMLRDAKLPSAFVGIPGDLMPATQVGMSEHFSVKTHGDSCISAVTETIFWANHNVKNGRFAVTSIEIAFDIGTRPCVLFQKGNEAHGTVPGTHGSCGLVLISKRNTLQQYRNDAYTDRTTQS